MTVRDSSPMEIRRQMVRELEAVFTAVKEEDAEALTQAILDSSRLFCYGVGREGLVMKSFCMRLMHLGLDAHVVGDMTAPPIGQRDLLLVSAGPGFFHTVSALVDVAKAHNARVALMTANLDSPLRARADVVVHIPGQTMAENVAAEASIQPMGSLYEQAMWLFFDYVVLKLAERTGQSFADLAQRHTNLE